MSRRRDRSFLALPFTNRFDLMHAQKWPRWLGLAIAAIVSLWTVAPALALGGPQPPVDEPAPEFQLPTNTGDGTVALSDFRGQWVVLYFYPKDFTSGCTVEARRFQLDMPEYRERNAQVLGVSADDVDSHAEFCESEELRFPLLSDTEGEVSKAYGSWLGFRSLRHTYLIDPEGILREVFLDVRPFSHSSEVLARLEELQQGGRA